MQRPLQLRAARGRGADLADDDAGAEIRETRRVRDIEARSDAGGEQRDHVSPAPVTSKTLRACAGSVRGSPSVNSVIPCSPRVTSSASRSSSPRSACALREQLALARATADDGLELAAIRGHGVRAAIAREVGAFRVDQHGHAVGAAHRDQLGGTAQRALRVIGKHDDVDAAHELRKAASTSAAQASSDCSASTRISCWLRAKTRSL